MIQLNLVPEKVRAAERLQLIIVVAAVFYGLAVLGLIWQWGQAEAKVLEAKHQVAAVQAELDAPDLQDAVKAVKKFTEDLDAVKVKASEVNQFRKDQVTVIRLLDTFPDWTMDRKVWFNSLETKGDKGKRSVVLAGTTLSGTLFAKFFSFMEGQALVKNLSVVTEPVASQVHGVPVVQFTVGFGLEDYQ